MGKNFSKTRLDLLQESLQTTRATPNIDVGANPETEKGVSVDTHAFTHLDSAPKLDLSNVDNDGAEVQGGDSAKTKLSGAVTVMSEGSFTPRYGDQPLLDQSVKPLLSLGYRPHKFMSVLVFSARGSLERHLNKRRPSKQMLDRDAAVLRSLTTLRAIWDKKTKHRTILYEAVVESFGPAIRSLDLRVVSNGEDPRYFDDHISHLPNLAE